jgi:hypothetical protein
VVSDVCEVETWNTSPCRRVEDIGDSVVFHARILSGNTRFHASVSDMCR